MVEASLLEITGTEKAELVETVDPPGRDEADLFVDGAVAFLEGRGDREELLDRVRACLAAKQAETKPAQPPDAAAASGTMESGEESG